MSSIKSLRSGSVPTTKDSNPVLPVGSLPAWNFQNTAAPLSSMYANAQHQVIVQGKGGSIKKPGS